MANTEATAQPNEKQLRAVVTDADVYLTQLANQTSATLHAVRAVLKQPDSVEGRMTIISLIASLDTAAQLAANEINTAAETVGANDVGDLLWQQDYSAVCAALRAGDSKP